MDFESVTICVAFVVVSAVIIYLTSHLAIKERSFDEVMEEQRRRHNLETFVKGSKVEKIKKDKKDKNRKLTKKAKEKDTKESKETNEIKETSGKNEKAGVKSEVNEQPVSSGMENIVASEPKTHKMHDHVDFKEPEVIILNDDESGIVRNRKLITTSDKAPKPILVHKSEHNLKADISNCESDAKYRKKNSFDIVRPKDELELVKFAKKHAEKEFSVRNSTPSTESQMTDLTSEKAMEANKHPQIKNVNGSHSGDINGDHCERLTEVEEVEVKEVKNQTQQKAKKHKPTNNVVNNGVSATEVASKRILKQINTCYFNNEEIQILINALLNKQSDGSSEWMKKNDPNDVLKKQLREKEQLLEAEKHNSQAAMARMKELRQELDQEKSKQNSDKLTQERELQALHSRYQQQQLLFQEQHRNEMKAVQAKMQHMQSKLSEERNLAVQRLQEENSIMQQRIQQLEGERANYEALSHLKHELEQMRAERQQWDRRQHALQQSNEELLHQVKQMEEHLNTLRNAKQAEEFTFQQKLVEIKNQLQQAENSNSSLMEELQQKHKECNNFDVESRSLKRKFDELVEDKQREVEQLRDKLNELSKDKKNLEECITARDELLMEYKNCSNSDKETEVKQLSAELNKCREELTNAKNEVETQKKLNEDLRKKGNEATEALSNIEKSVSRRIADAVSKEVECREADQRNLRDIQQQHDTLRNEKHNFINCLNKLIPTTDSNVLNSLQQILDEVLQLRKSDTVDKDALHQQIHVLKQQLDQKDSLLLDLQAKVDKYKNLLSETNNMLLNLENKARDEESHWRRTLEQKES